MKQIETLDKWQAARAALKEKQYRLWQMQYGVRCPEGFHAWFYLPGKQDIEIVTHSMEVQKAIVKYN